jgi:general secretion pathway protein H
MTARRRHSQGMTILEMMIVIAIIGLGMVAMRSGFRAITKADLAEDTTELATFLRGAGQLAIEHGEVHRVVFDFDSGAYLVERCEGARTISRDEKLRTDDEKTKEALERSKDRVKDMATQVGSAAAPSSPEDELRQATAIAGHHVADRMCAPVTTSDSHDTTDKGWQRRLRGTRDIKFKEIWVQHVVGSTTRGQVALYFFPNGTSEKAVLQLTDGEAIHSILVQSLTGTVQQKSSRLEDVDGHMLRNAMGDREKKRENEQ